MIRHIVFFTAKSKQDVAAMAQELRVLGDIPHSASFQVALNMKVDPIPDEIDIVVYAEFQDPEALAAYRAHPLYAATTTRVRPMRALRFSADIVV